MGSLINKADERVKNVSINNDMLNVELMDGRIICVPTAWFPQLFNANKEQLENWKIAGAGYGIYWPELDEDLSTEGLLRGAPAPGNFAKSA